jgi:hypothetical protein
LQRVVEEHSTEVAAAMPNLNPVALPSAKPLPTIVIDSPPSFGPLAGPTRVTVGASKVNLPLDVGAL